MLREFGAALVTTFDTRADALTWLQSNTPDVAVVDPRLNSADVDEPVFKKGGWISKPTMPGTLSETLARLLP